MSNIHYTPEAEDDLVGIKRYIAEDRNSPVAALNTITKITKKIRILDQFPELGTRLSSVIDIATDYRFLVCGNYIAFYRLDGNDVYVIRILYGRRDYVKILFGELPKDDAQSDT
jgi:plasmid stabilization system protein ParE